MTDFEKSVLTGLATLQAEMRQMKESTDKALAAIEQSDRRVTTLEHGMSTIQADSGEFDERLTRLEVDVQDLKETRTTVKAGVAWSVHALQAVWYVLAALIGAAVTAVGYFAKQ